MGRAKKLIDEGIQVVDVDIRNIPAVEELIIQNSVTHVVHLAAQAGVRYAIRNPKAYVDINLDGFIQVMEMVCRHPSLKFIYASSSSVYGINTKIPFSETDITETPCSLYGATKKSNELIAHAYHHMYGICVTGLRYFTVYGPWGRPDMAYFSFTEAIMAEKPIQLYNQGNMQRDFTYIEDIVEGTAAAIDLSAPYEIFNLGNNHPEEILTLVTLIEKYTGKKAIKELAPMEQGDVLMTYAGISKSRATLQFNPKVSLEEGMKRFLEWYFMYKKLSTNSISPFSVID